jgi:hypothetical protein
VTGLCHAGLVTGLVPSAASRYIAAQDNDDDDDGCQHLAPPPLQRTGARLIFVVPPERGPRQFSP